MQVAAFAHLTGNEPLMADARTRFKTVLLEQAMRLAEDAATVERGKVVRYLLFERGRKPRVAGCGRIGHHPRSATEPRGGR